MAKSSIFALVFCLALSAAFFPFAAKGDPKILTSNELATVTAGQVALPPIHINVNTTVQIARAIATSIAICAACTNAAVTAFSEATAFNINLVELTNAF